MVDVMIRVAINGFGRIGRNMLRAACQHSQYGKLFEIVAINDLGNTDILAHLLKYDSIYGKFNGTIEKQDDGLVVNGHFIRFFSLVNPEKLPWNEMNINIALESTGIFRSREGAMKHILAGAEKVIISAPAKDPDFTVVLGVNHDQYEKDKHKIISNASCTTNSLAPPAKIINENFGIQKGIMTTIHSYTGDQRILDFPHKDFRRARAAATSIIPTTTGAAKAVSLVIPELKGKLDGMAVRVPTPDGSLTDFTCQLHQDVTADDVNRVLKDASAHQLKGIMQYIEDPVVSVDIIGNSHSAVIDGLSTKVIGDRGNLVKILSWYDNEWGYSCRLVDLVNYLYTGQVTDQKEIEVIHQNC
jgi:glyceraldehyde 3-phosphate dehydrogenase